MIEFNEECSEFIKISEKYNHHADFLNQTLTIFLENKEEIKEESYKEFLENNYVSVENYVRLEKIIEIYPEFKVT